MRNPAKLTLATPSSARRASGGAPAATTLTGPSTRRTNYRSARRREPDGEHAIGPRLQVEPRAPHGLLEQLAAIAFAAQHVDPRVQDDVEPASVAA